MSNGTYTRDMFDSTKRYRGVLLQRSTAGRPVYIVDSDFTDWAKIVQAQQQDLGRFFADGTEDTGMAISGSEGRSNDFYIMQGRGLCNGLIPEVHSSTPYTCDEGFGFSDALADQIHRRWTVVNDGVLSDAHALYNTNALVGYYVCIGDDAYQVTANTATSISLSGFTASTVTSHYYYIRLKTPAAPVDQDVWLDCHLEDWGAAEDPDLDHNPGGNAIECARRLKLVQSVLVQQGNFVTISSSGYDKHGYLDASGTQHWCLRLGHLARVASEYLLTSYVVADAEFYAGSHPEVVAARDNGLFNAYESTNLADRLKRDRVAITVGKSSELGQYTGDDGLMQAVSAYAKIIVLKAGDYTLLADLDIPEGCVVVGENKATVTITVPLGNSINIGANAALMRVKLLRASGVATAPVVLLDGVQSKLLDCTIVDSTTSVPSTVEIGAQAGSLRAATVADCNISKASGACVQVLPLEEVLTLVPGSPPETVALDNSYTYSMVSIENCTLTALAGGLTGVVTMSEAGVVALSGCNLHTASGALRFEGKAVAGMTGRDPDRLLVTKTVFHRSSAAAVSAGELAVIYGGEANFTDCVFTFANKTVSNAIGATVRLRDYDTAPATALFTGCRLEAGTLGFDIQGANGCFVQINNCDIDMLAYSTSGVYASDSFGKVQVTNSRVQMPLGGGANQAFNCNCDLRLSGVYISAMAAYAIKQFGGNLSVNNSVITCSDVAIYMALGVAARVIGGEVNALTFVQSAGTGTFSAANCNVIVAGDAFTGSTAAVELTGCTVTASDNLTAAACVPSRLSIVGGTIHANTTGMGLAQGTVVDLRSTKLTAYLPIVKGSTISVVGCDFAGTSAPAIYAANSAAPTVIRIRGSASSASSGVKACVVQNTTAQPVHLSVQGCVFANGVNEAVADGPSAAYARSLMLLLGTNTAGDDTDYDVTLQGCTFGYGVYLAAVANGAQSYSSNCSLTVNDCHMGNAGLYDSASTDVRITGGTYSTAVCTAPAAVGDQHTSAIYFGPATNSEAGVAAYLSAKAEFGNIKISGAQIKIEGTPATGFTKTGLSDTIVLRRCGIFAAHRSTVVQGVTVQSPASMGTIPVGIMLGAVYKFGTHATAQTAPTCSYAVSNCHLTDCLVAVGTASGCVSNVTECDFLYNHAALVALLPAVVLVPATGTVGAFSTIIGCKGVGAIAIAEELRYSQPAIVTPPYDPAYTPPTSTKLGLLPQFTTDDFEALVGVDLVPVMWPWPALTVSRRMSNSNTLAWVESTAYSPVDWPAS